MKEPSFNLLPGRSVFLTARPWLIHYTARLRHFLLFVFAVAPLLNLTCPAQQAQPVQPANSAQREAWRKSMKQIPLPNKGCFKASYPSSTWQEAKCVTAPLIPFPPTNNNIPPTGHPSASGTGPETVGNLSNDWVAVSSSSTLASAEGVFLSVSGLESAGTYSLQLNTNTWSGSPACAGAEYPPACSAWQQFVYTESSPPATYMQYWLLNWGTTCPGGWNTLNQNGGINCWKNSSAITVSTQGVDNLPYLSMEGEASGGTDTAILFTPDTGALSAVAQDSVLGLEQGWTQAEFNVFGNGNGSQVNFNSGTTFAVQTSMYNGTTNAPSCSQKSFTGETNNLTLVPYPPNAACCPYGGYEPGIQFVESNASGATATCGPNGLSNLAQTPYVENATATVIGGGNPPTIEFSANLMDDTPGATINYLLYACGNEVIESGSVSSGGGIYYTQYSGDYPGCSITGSAYATAPGYLQSSTTGFNF